MQFSEVGIAVVLTGAPTQQVVLATCPSLAPGLSPRAMLVLPCFEISVYRAFKSVLHCQNRFSRDVPPLFRDISSFKPHIFNVLYCFFSSHTSLVILMLQNRMYVS